MATKPSGASRHDDAFRIACELCHHASNATVGLSRIATSPDQKSKLSPSVIDSLVFSFDEARRIELQSQAAARVLREVVKRCQESTGDSSLIFSTLADAERVVDILFKGKLRPVSGQLLHSEEVATIAPRLMLAGEVLSSYDTSMNWVDTRRLELAAERDRIESELRLLKQGQRTRGRPTTDARDEEWLRKFENQGYVLSKPKSVEAFTATLNSRRTRGNLFEVDTVRKALRRAAKARGPKATVEKIPLRKKSRTKKQSRQS